MTEEKALPRMMRRESPLHHMPRKRGYVPHVPYERREWLNVLLEGVV